MKDGATLRDRAIDQLELKFGEEWIETAVAEIRAVAIENPLGFTSDDVWPNLPSVDEPRAMGAAFTRARKLKIIKPIDEWRCSRRAECHRRPLRVWVKA